MPDETHELPSLKALQQKIDQAKPPEAKEGSAALEYSKDLSMAVRFLVELVAGVGVGGLLGYTIDRWLGTLPVFLILCLLLGMAAGVRNMMREAKAVENSKMTEEKSPS